MKRIKTVRGQGGDKVPIREILHVNLLFSDEKEISAKRNKQQMIDWKEKSLAFTVKISIFNIAEKWMKKKL